MFFLFDFYVRFLCFAPLLFLLVVLFVPLRFPRVSCAWLLVFLGCGYICLLMCVSCVLSSFLWVVLFSVFHVLFLRFALFCCWLVCFPSFFMYVSCVMLFLLLVFFI